MNRVVDSSVVLAVIYREEGWERWVDLLEGGILSSVNLAEVQSKLVSEGMPARLAWEAATQAVSQVIAFDAEQARHAGDLILKSREFGLSLGDRSCLALAMVTGLPVHTADRAWKRLRTRIEIHVIR